MTALNAAGLESTPSTTANATIGAAGPAAHTGLIAAANDSGVALDWTDGPSDGVGYNVYASATSTGTFTKVNGPSTVVSAWDDTLAPSGTTYHLVKAVNSAGIESAASATVNASMAKANLMLNPSFEIEANADGRPDSWTSNSRFTRTTAAVRSGAYAGQFLTTSNTSITIGQNRTGLSAGRAYTFAGWVNIPATTDTFTLSLQVQWRNSSNSVISTQTVATHNGQTSGWVKALATLTSPTGTTRATVNIVCNSLRGTHYVEDITMR